MQSFDQIIPDLREQAEKKLVAQPQLSTELPVEDTLRLQHELEVHRIELEMQNETLREALRNAEAVHQRYFDHYDLAPVGYLTLSERGEILELNMRASKLLGLSKEKLLGRQVREFFANSSLASLELFMTTARQTGLKVDSQTLNIRRKGLPLVVNATARKTNTLSYGSRCLQIALTDVTVLVETVSWISEIIIKET